MAEYLKVEGYAFLSQLVAVSVVNFRNRERKNGSCKSAYEPQEARELATLPREPIIGIGAEVTGQCLSRQEVQRHGRVV